MSRHRNRTRTLKAMPSDGQMIAGTLADLAAKQIGNNEIYWKLFKSQPIVRSCVTLIANAVAEEGYDIKPVDDGEDIENDERVAMIHDFFRIASVGRFNTFRKMMKALVCDHQTYGAAYLLKKYGRANGAKALAGLERLDARYIIPKLTQDKTAIDYFVQVQSKPEVSGAVQQAAQQISAISGQVGIRYSPDEIIMFTTDDGGDAVLPSPSPLEALDLSCGMDMQVRKHRNSFFANGATMGNVICCVDATDDQVRDAQTKLSLQHVGVRKAFTNLAIGGDWKLLKMIDSGRLDIDFIKGTTITTEEIMMVYKIPPGKLKNVQGAMGQAGKGEDDETFEEECVLPIEECMYECLTLEILQKEFEIDDLRIIPARRNKLRLDRFAAALTLVKIGGTGNEARDLVGLKKIDKSDDFDLDIPLFLGATGQGVAADSAQPAGAQPPSNGKPGTGDVTTPQQAAAGDRGVDDNVNGPPGTKRGPNGVKKTHSGVSNQFDVVSDKYDRIASDIFANRGITVGLDDSKPTSGFAIGGIKGGDGKSLGRVYAGSSFGGKEVKDFMESRNETLSQPGNFMGGWQGEDNRVHLDPVTVHGASDPEGALSTTHDRDEIAMYDLSGKGGQSGEYYTMSDHERPSESSGHQMTAAENDKIGGAKLDAQGAAEHAASPDSGSLRAGGDHWVTVNGAHVLLKADQVEAVEAAEANADNMKRYAAWHDKVCRCEEVADTSAKAKARARVLAYLGDLP